MNRGYLFLLLLFLMVHLSLAQEIKQVEFSALIDQPTAGSLEQGQYGFNLDFFPYGGSLVGMNVGLFKRFMLGVSYGGRNFIGQGDVEWNEMPGVLIKYRLFEETDFPALAVGFDNQGYGLWSDTLNRYEVKAKGLFAVLSKNYSLGWLGSLGLHGGVNFNSIEDDDDRNLNAFCGIDKSINEEISLLAEYNFGLDDNSPEAFGKDRGYLNAGVRWVFAKQLGIEFNFKDILTNQKDVSSISRELRIRYVETF